MTRQSVALAVGALILGAGLGGFGARELSRRVVAETEPVKGWKGKEVVVAASSIPIGGLLTEAALARRIIPEEFADGSYVPSEDARHLVGTRSISSFAPGEFIRWHAVAEGYPSGACEQLRAWKSQGRGATEARMEDSER